MTRRVAAVALYFLAGCATQEWIRPYDGLAGDRNRYAFFLVREAGSERPIAGATVRGYREWALTEGGRWAPLVHAGKTDEFGIVRFDLADNSSQFHWVAEAPGFAPEQEYGARLFETFELAAGRDYRARILGPVGAPVTGMTVEYKLGCAHAPALRTARTDARGVFHLRNVGDPGDLCFHAPGCGAAYWFGPQAEIGQSRTYVMEPGGRIRGRLLDGAGRPFAGAIVQGGTRGPLVRCDADGSFLIEGAESRTRVSFFTGEHFGVAVDLRPYRPGGPLVVRWGAPAPDATAAAGVVARCAGRAVACDVHLDRRSDGRRYTNAERVPPGEYLVSAGSTFSRWFGAPRAWRSGRKIEVEEQPRLRVEGRPSEARRLRVVVDGHAHELPEPDEPPLHLPATGRAVVTVRMADRVFFFEVEPALDGERRVRVRLPEPALIVLPRIEGAYSVEPQDWEVAADQTIRTWRTGPLRLSIHHETRGAARFRFVVRAGVTVRLPPPVFVAPPVAAERTRSAAGGIDLPGETRAVLDGVAYEGTDLRLRDLEPGWHTLLVQPAGRRGYAARFALRSGETRIFHR